MSSPQHHKINPPWGRVSGCLQCNTSTQSYVCCGHSPGKSPPSSLPTCAALAPAAARLSAAASPLSSRISPASKAAASLFSLVEPHVPPWGPAGCSLRFSVGVGDGGSFSPGLHRTNGDDEEAADKRRAGAAAQRCRLLASPLEAEGREGWSLRTLLLHFKTVVILRDNMPPK